jgi:pimeloyl-[acyl-carrier protein] methyl ester esterase
MLTLVLLPGMDGTGIFFEDFAALARPEFDSVIVRYPDDPSCGYAGLEPVARAALPCHKPFLILGESFSGPIAISIAASKPPGLVGLILCVTFACNPHPLLPLATAILKPFPPVRLPSFIQHRHLFGKYDSPRLRAKLRGVRAAVSQKTLKARLEAVASVDVSEPLRRVTAATLDLRAKDDRVISRASGDHIRNVLPHVETAELEAPHLMLQTVPHHSLAAIRRFVLNKIKIPN